MIELEGLTKQFGSLTAVNGVTFTVHPGEVLALLGPNGAGKTTTVRMLAAILKPTAGRARVAGFDVRTQATEVRRRVGVLTEAPGLYTRMTGWEYLEFFGEIRGLSADERTTRIRHLSEQFRMSEALERRLGQYSRGMSQKIALIRTLLHNPPVLLLDEPTATMDPESARLVRDAILQMRDDEHRAIIICTHNLPEAEELADRIALIRRGEIVALGSVAELKARLLGPPLMEVRFSVPFDGRPLVSRLAEVVAVGETWVRYRPADAAAINPRVIRLLLEAHAPLLTVSEVPQSLESIYLRIIEGDHVETMA